jgi:hypothetical protein
MKSVFLLWQCEDWEPDELVGSFSSNEKAQAYKDKMIAAGWNALDLVIEESHLDLEYA